VSAAGVREAFAHNGSRRQPGRNSLEAIEPVSTERLPPAWIIHGDLLLQFPVATKRAERGSSFVGAAPLVVSVGRVLFKDGEPSGPALQRRYRLYKRSEATSALPAGAAAPGGSL
jgi:hypothetical protein